MNAEAAALELCDTSDKKKLVAKTKNPARNEGHLSNGRNHTLEVQPNSEIQSAETFSNPASPDSGSAGGEDNTRTQTTEGKQVPFDIVVRIVVAILIVAAIGITVPSILLFKEKGKVATEATGAETPRPSAEETTSVAPVTSESCGGYLKASLDDQRFASPGFSSGGYWDNMTCVWTIVSPPGTRVSLSFPNFHLQGRCSGAYDNCVCADSVKISEGSLHGRTVKTFCGTLRNPGHDYFNTTLYNASRISVVFESDGAITQTGFLATYKSVEDGNDCKPNSCENGGTCVDGHFSFTCRCTTNYLGPKCETYSESGCGENVVLKTSPDWRILASPNYPHLYLPKMSCNWTIQAPARNKIAINFTHFDLGSGCWGDTLRFMNVEGGTKHFLKSFCGYRLPEAFESGSSALSVQFRTDASGQHTGFRLKYKTATDHCIENPCPTHRVCVNTVDSYHCQCPHGFIGDNCATTASCGGNLQATGVWKQFASPGYPLRYNNSQSCVWTIRAEDRHGIRLRFVNVSLGYCCDTVTVYKGVYQSRIGRVGYHSTNTSFFSDLNSMKIDFKSDSSVTYKGFLAEFIEVVDEDDCTSNPCLNNGTCHDGVFNYSCSCPPNYLGGNCQYLDDDSCQSNPCASGATCVDGVLQYTCQCPPGKFGIHCQADDPCSSNPCKSGGTCTPMVIGTSVVANCLCPRNYEGDFCHVHTACSGSATLGLNNTVYIGSFGSYRYRCTWTVQAPIGSFIVVTFVQFKLDPGCTNSKVTITDGNTTVSYCSMHNTSYIPNEQITSNQIILRLYEIGYLEKVEIRLQLGSDYCMGNECKNGTCVNGKNSYICQCYNGYRGARCDLVDACSSNPCFRGRCTPHDSGYLCNCDSEYKGPSCNDRNEACIRHECAHGICAEPPLGVSATRSYICRCEQGWTGRYCNESDCGKKDIQGVGKIIAGRQAIPHSWPWHVAILKDNPNLWDGRPMKDFLECGGALITPRHVLTAAHCIHLSKYVAISVHDLTEECRDPCKVIKVIKATKHSLFGVFSDYDSDVGVLELEHNVTFSQTIRKICLPTQNQVFAAGTEVTIIGWGDTRRHGRYDSISRQDYPNKLREAVIPLLSRTVCQRKEGRLFTSNMLCAENLQDGTPSATCHGDSGGAVQMRVNGSWTAIGLVSWGYGCGDSRYPDVYTKVSNFVTWIRNHV